MSTVLWSTLIFDEMGVIDYARVRALISILLALGGGVALLLSMAGVLHPGEYVTLGTSSLVLPLTGGKIADAIVGRKNGTV